VGCRGLQGVTSPICRLIAARLCREMMGWSTSLGLREKGHIHCKDRVKGENLLVEEMQIIWGLWGYCGFIMDLSWIDDGVTMGYDGFGLL
jgi:hypothetical protein